MVERVRSKRELSYEKRAVWEGKLNRTKSGLTKGDLMENKYGKIVSKRQHAAGRRLQREFPIDTYDMAPEFSGSRRRRR